MMYFIKKNIKYIDQNISRTYLNKVGEKDALLSFLFHNLFKNKEQIKSWSMDPQQGITVEIFEYFIKYFLDNGYSFVSPNDIVEDSLEGKNILLTFDDGYYNNMLALPIMKKYNVPAVFFISTNHIKENKSFWWDVLYREMVKRGASSNDITLECKKLKTKKNNEIEKILKEKYGNRCLTPIDDIDRPFSKSELKDFSKEKLVHLGNHTADHALLVNYSCSEINNQILNCQKDIYQITGKLPSCIAYPNGYYNKKVIDISKNAGLKMGVTVDPKKNYLPISSNDLLLGRYVVNGYKDLIKQFEIFRSDISIQNLL